MLSTKEQMQAILWKGEQLGLSYGKIVSRSSAQELNRIYADYEEILAERKRQSACTLPVKGRRQYSHKKSSKGSSGA